MLPEEAYSRYIQSFISTRRPARALRLLAAMREVGHKPPHELCVAAVRAALQAGVAAGARSRRRAWLLARCVEELEALAGAERAASPGEGGAQAALGDGGAALLGGPAEGGASVAASGGSVIDVVGVRGAEALLLYCAGSARWVERAVALYDALVAHGHTPAVTATNVLLRACGITHQARRAQAIVDQRLHAVVPTKPSGRASAGAHGLNHSSFQLLAEAHLRCRDWPRAAAALETGAALGLALDAPEAWDAMVRVAAQAHFPHGIRELRAAQEAAGVPKLADGWATDIEVCQYWAPGNAGRMGRSLRQRTPPGDHRSAVPRQGSRDALNHGVGLLAAMRREGVAPDARHYAAVVRLAAAAGDVRTAFATADRAWEAGVTPSAQMLAYMAEAAAGVGLVDLAAAVVRRTAVAVDEAVDEHGHETGSEFDDDDERSNDRWVAAQEALVTRSANALLLACIDNRQFGVALATIDMLEDRGSAPLPAAFVSLLELFCRCRDAESAVWLSDRMKRTGLSQRASLPERRAAALALLAALLRQARWETAAQCVAEARAEGTRLPASVVAYLSAVHSEGAAARQPA